MDTTILDSIIKQIIEMSPSVLLAFVLMGLGWTLKTWPVFNDRYIPHGLILTGAIVWPFLGDHALGLVLRVCQGIAIGLGAVGAHQFLKKQFGEKEEPTK